MPSYFVKRGENGSPKGPLELSVIKKLASQKKIIANDFISVDKIKWHQAKDIRGLISEPAVQDETVDYDNESSKSGRSKKIKSKKSGRLKKTSKGSGRSKRVSERTPKSGKSRRSKRERDDDDEDGHEERGNRKKKSAGVGKLILSITFSLIALVLVGGFLVLFLTRGATNENFAKKVDAFAADTSKRIAYDQFTASWFSDVSAEKIQRNDDSAGYKFFAQKIVIKIGAGNAYSWYSGGEDSFSSLKAITVLVEGVKLENTKSSETITLDNGEFVLSGNAIEDILTGDSDKLFESFKNAKGVKLEGDK